jgi:hypothetical protein
MYFRENATLSVSNPILEDMSKPVTEALLSDIKIKEVRAIYPLVKAINSGRLTRNYTYYPAESLIGKNKTEDPTGYSSFVKPFGKPVLREHQAQKVMGMVGPIEEADVPMGRIVFSGFRRRQEKKDGPGTSPLKKYVPGTVEGDGTLYAVPAITDPEAITRVLGGAYHTVSIGSRVDNVWEAISGKNIAEIRRKGEELPPYERGQLYEGRLSYWRMGEIRGVELSFVNVPSDEYAGVVDPDIGAEGIRLLVAEKKSGKSNEYNFFDAKTSEKVTLDMDEFIFDESFFVDSVKVGHDIWWLNNNSESVTESAEDEEAQTYCCPDHPNMTSFKAATCPTCGKTMKKMEDDGEDDEDEATKPNESEEIDMAKGFDLQEATVAEIIAEAQKSEDKGSFNELLLTTFDTEEDVTDLVDGSGERIENAELFAEISEFATQVCEDWNEKAAKFALSLYLNKGGTLKSPLVESEEEISSIGYRLEGEDVILMPILVNHEGKVTPLVEIRNAEELNLFADNLTHYNEMYQIWASKEALELFATNTKAMASVFENPEEAKKAIFAEVTIEGLLHFVKASEFNESRQEIATLAGLVRQGKVVKEDLDGAYKAYKVFGTSVLRKFIEAAPIKETAPVEVETTPVEETPAVETIPDPVVVAEKSEEVSRTSKESKDVWLGFRVRPAKKNGKHPVNNKEKS